MAKLSFQYVSGIQSPESLINFLCRRFKYNDGDKWMDMILQGRVTVNGAAVMPHYILETGNKVLYEQPEGGEPEIDVRYDVLYEDDDLLAVSKSGNIPTSPSGKYWHNCLVHLLQKEKGIPGLYAVHRLDRETSGINLFAKTKHSAKIMGNKFNQGEIFKSYTAICKGYLPEKQVIVSGRLGKDPESGIHIKQAIVPDGRPSQTIFHLQAYFPQASLVSIFPLTGRTHQIRAHAQHIGHPIVGDKLYGASEESFLAWLESGERNSTDRHLLHATQLSFQHPTQNKEVHITSSPKGIIQLYLNNLRPLHNCQKLPF
ncbi:MAG: RluA family pseudouridine synthase [Deltaproteobacteria bacterium]|nr:RluA family pseudouridine synthase [Deltaproteobacteria bacterium]